MSTTWPPAASSPTIAFSDLNEDVCAGSADLAYRLPIDMPITLVGRLRYTKAQRTSSRFQFQYFRPDGALPIEIAQERPDFLVSDFNVFFYDIELRDISGAEGAAAYDAALEINAGYGQAEIEPSDGSRWPARRPLRGCDADGPADRHHARRRPSSTTITGCRRRP